MGKRVFYFFMKKSGRPYRTLDAVSERPPKPQPNCCDLVLWLHFS